jgi:hypothetical protein
LSSFKTSSSLNSFIPDAIARLRKDKSLLPNDVRGVKAPPSAGDRTGVIWQVPSSLRRGSIKDIQGADSVRETGRTARGASKKTA